MKQKGVTLIELMVVIVMVLVVGTMMATGFAGLSGNSNISVGINGVSEVRCIEGYKFVINQDGRMTQILDEFAKGVRCSQMKEMK